MEKKATPEHAFTHGTRAAGHSLTSLVTHRADNLKTHQVSILKRKARGLSNGLARHSTTCCRGPDPIPQIAELVDAVDLVDAAAPKEPAIVTDDRERVFMPLGGELTSRVDPVGCLGHRVLRVAPR